MEKRIAKRKMVHRKYKHYAAALAGAAILAGTSLHGGAPFVRAEAADSPTPPITTTQSAPLDADSKTKTPVESANQGDTTTNQHDKNNDQKDRADKNSGDKDKDHRDNERDHKKYSQDNRYDHARYAHERWADRHHSLAQRLAWYNESLNKIQFYNSHEGPVDLVMTSAPDLGFDATTDTFTLVSQSDLQAIVNVVHAGATYNVTLNHVSSGNWRIALVNQIS